MEIEIKNAKIEDTMFGFEEHGILTSMIHLDYGDGGHQGFGGYSLGKTATDEWLRGILHTLEVEKWEQLKGKYVRVKIENHRIIAIGNLLKDEWFNPKELWKNK